MSTPKEEGEYKNRKEFKEITTGNFPNMKKDTNLHTQEPKQTTYFFFIYKLHIGQIQNDPKPRHAIGKFSKTKKIL